MHVKSFDKIVLTEWKFPHSIPDTVYGTDKLFRTVGVHVYMFQVRSVGVWHRCVITIPDGFLWDKRSLGTSGMPKFIKRFLRMFRTRDGKCEVPALAHDYLGRTKGGMVIGDIGGSVTIDGEPGTFGFTAWNQSYKGIYIWAYPEKTKEAKKDFFWLMRFSKGEFGKKTPPALR